MTARPGHTPADAIGTVVAPDLADLLARPAREQQAGGYWYTAAEIAQQPETWVETAQSLVADRDAIEARLTRAGLLGGRTARGVILTGSGSSVYVGEASARWLQRRWQSPVAAVASGEILTHLDAWVPDGRPGLVVSFARSGDSPESAATLDAVLAARPDWEHLIITCNGSGRLATEHRAHPSVHTIVLDSRTCDRSLVMTSSFTNMVVAAHGLAALHASDDYQRRVALIADVGRSVFSQSSTLASLARRSFTSAIFLGSGGRFGAAREAALKMLEMTAGRVHTMAETFLGLRHGPMSAVHDDTLVVCFLSAEAVTRAYELDLIHELNQKSLGTHLIVGEALPDGLVRASDAAIECSGLSVAGDDLAAVTDVVVGQLLALFRCLAVGLRPDAPSNNNVINRVVTEFTIHRRSASS
jgi:tagatose-6-phosphate ketose/aldose isomerase